MREAFQILHIGDLHLGAPFKDVPFLGKSMEEALIRATYQSFEGVIQLAVAQRVEAVLINGDVYDPERATLEAQTRLMRGFRRLDEAHIPVYICESHQGLLDPAHMYLPENVHVFSKTSPHRFPFFVKGKEVGGVYGQSGATSGVNAAIRPLEQDQFAIAMTKEDPKTIPADSHISYWALGNLEGREVLSRDPYIVYASPIQGISPLTEGTMGASIVRVLQRRIDVDFRETSPLRFETITIDLSSLTSERELLEMIRHKKEMVRRTKRDVLVRFVFTGTSPLHELCRDGSRRNEWRDRSNREEHGHQQVIIYHMEDQSSPMISLQERRSVPDMIGDYLRAYDGIGQLDTIKQLGTLREVMGSLGEETIPMELLTDDILHEAFQRAEEEGISRLLGESHED